MKSKTLKRISVALSALVAGVLMSQGLFELASDLNAQIVHADSSNNTVEFLKTSYDANDSSLVYVEIDVQGHAGDVVKYSYKTYSGTAIENVDYQGISNTRTVKIPLGNRYTEKIAIKCLSNDQGLRTYEGDNDYGRYFNLEITGVDNGNIGTNKSCKCYLNYTTKVEATTNIKDEMIGRESAYINDYQTMLMEYEDGISNLDGKSTWKSWKNGMSFNNDTTRRWVNTYINTGYAKAYGSLLAKLYEGKYAVTGGGDVSVLAGNREFIDKYNRDKNCPGLVFYVKTDPPGANLDGRAMDYISQGTNPYKKDDDLIDIDERYKLEEDRQKAYWILDRKTWFSNKNSVYGTVFYKINPYNGVLDFGVAAYNHAKEEDMKFEKLWGLMTLIDSKNPTITNQYCEYNTRNGTIRVYLRFDEPVFTSMKKDLDVKINQSSTVYKAKYVEGNYSDTLVYEIPEDNVPKTKITAVTYQLPNDDIGDMAYNLDGYKVIKNNRVQNTDMQRSATISDGSIDLIMPQVKVDIISSLQPHNIYNITISTNASRYGTESFDSGTVYYHWTKEETIDDPKNPVYYSHSHELTPEEQGTFTVTLAKSGGYESGDYNLFVLVVSKYGFTANNKYGKYRLDGDSPIIEQKEPEKNDLQSKTYVLEVQNKAIGTSIDSINLIVEYKDKEGADKVARRPIVIGGEIAPGLAGIVSKVDGENSKIYKYKSNIDDTDESVPVDTLFVGTDPENPGIMTDLQRLKCSISFEVIDLASNKSTTSALKTIYDKSSYFEMVITKPESYVIDNSISIPSATVYNVAGAATTDGLRFEVTNSSMKELVDDGAKFGVNVNGVKHPATTEDKYFVVLANLAPGYYEISGYIEGTLISTSTEVSYATQPAYFYLTNGYAENTANKVKTTENLVLANYVYQLSDARFYYYRPSNSSVSNHLYGATYNPSIDKYEGGSNNPAFSSIIEAKKYIKYMEYQDMNLISITDNIASVLNGGSGSTVYVKAPGETKNAQKGQLWLQYKKNTWTDTVGANGWAFYYYGEGKVEDGININGLSANLNAALEAVTNRICNQGEIAYLLDDNNIDRNGAPYLTDGQKHVDVETVSESKQGSKYVTNPTYNGDPSLYRNNVEVNGESYPLATNLELEITEGTYLFYRYFETTKWTQIDAEDGDILKNVLSAQSSGLYEIREYDENGVSQYTVYIDNSLPTVQAISNVGLADETEITLNGEFTNISCKSLTLDEIVNEADDLSYVAIYSYPNRRLIKVLYRDDAELKGYTLSGGNFYVQVGDRSGNSITYRVLTSDTQIDLTAKENDNKTAVVVKINNREANEIYSYEVYLNEVLIDSEFDTQKVYRESGIYRIVVKDIYGTEASVMITHESPSPDLTWYYLNDDGTYSVYDPNKESRMILKDDPSSPRTTLVSSSTMVRIRLNSSYESGSTKFEMTDIEEGSYTYNESTGLLTINNVGNWKLKVWYANNPDNYRYYIFNLDNEAPNIGGTFIGNSFAYKVVTEGEDDDKTVISTSTFDSMNFDNYQEGDTLTLDYLDYQTNEGERETMSFENGAFISGSHIVITVNDPSGIRSVSVTRNGQPVEMQLSEENQLTINGYGKYIITVTDKLGNVSTFSFTNIEGAVTRGALDGEILEENILGFGHDNLEVMGIVPGTVTILVKTEEGSFTYEFHFDGSNLTFGKYILATEEYKNMDDVLVVNKYAQYIETVGFILYANSDLTKLGTWYSAVENDHFIIYAMIDNDKLAHYKVQCVDQEITAEARFTVGNTHLPERYVARLSNEVPNVILLTGGEPVIEKEGYEYIYISDDLTIDKSSVSSSITKIEYVYSKNPVVGEEYITIYENGTWIEDFVGKEFGFYQFKITNIFGNQKAYSISKIESFASVVNVNTLDGAQITFYENEGTIYSNYTIELIVYSDSVVFEVDGVITSGYVEGGKTTLTLNIDGTYSVKVIGENGIFENFSFVIGNDEEFVYQDKWISGYNTEALLYEQGYTNTLCSIHLGEDVLYVGMNVNDERYIVLYDNLSEDKKTDLDALVNAIGMYGNGKYTIEFRNKYGDLVTKVIHYCDTPSLLLTRNTVADPSAYQVYDLAFAVEKGFYSNYALCFSTTSHTYKFTVSGNEYRLDETYRIEFTNAGGKGSFSYVVTYLDEYGNYVEFEAILFREDVDFDATSMETVTISGQLYTRDDICITFEEGLKATMSFNGGTPTDYLSGTEHYADGEYKFVVRDIAGNIATYVINHKSVNHYTLTNSLTGEEVIRGGVINNARVIYSASDDSKILYVVRNGEIIEYNSNTFNTTGHYEILIEDQIGNQSFEDFYIINNSLCEFSYDAPFDYEVSEVWRIKSDGTREILNIRGPHIKLDTDGDYIVVVTSTKTTSSFNFSVTIDKTLPSATLVGVEDGGVTARDVTITGLRVGDIVKIYKDGVLTSTTEVTLSTNPPAITTGGKYRVVITNVQGMTIEYNFTRKAIANVAGSIFIIVSSSLLVVGIAIGLIYHTKLKTDD